MTIPTKPVSITDEQVEAALCKFYAGLPLDQFPASAYDDMRAALTAAAQAGKDASTIEEMKHEQELFDEDARDRQRTLDRIADLIGLPHDQELDQTVFELWWDKNDISAAIAAHGGERVEPPTAQITEDDGTGDIISPGWTPPDTLGRAVDGWQPIKTAPNNIRMLVEKASDANGPDEIAMAWLDRADGEFWYSPQGGMLKWTPQRWRYLPGDDAPSPPAQSGEGLCTFGPPEERRPHWILKFEDADMGDMHFDDGAEAHAKFRSATDNWNCTLLVTAHEGERVEPPMPAAAVRTSLSADESLRRHGEPSPDREEVMLSDRLGPEEPNNQTCETPPGSAPDTLGRADDKWQLVRKALQHAKTDYLEMICYVGNREGTPYGLLQSQKLVDDALALLAASPSSPPQSGERKDEDLASKLRCFGTITVPSRDGWSYLNEHARILVLRAADSIATLTADVTHLHELSDARLRAIACYKSEIDALTQELAEAEKVIEPFAEYEKNLGGPDSDPVSSPRGTAYLSVGSFRAARAFKEHNKAKGEK